MDWLPEVCEPDCTELLSRLIAGFYLVLIMDPNLFLLSLIYDTVN